MLKMTWVLIACILTQRGVRAASLKGNPVRIRDGPAAVTGDESRNKATARHSLVTSCLKKRLHLIMTSECRVGRRDLRVIRESEDLPE